MNSSAGGQVPSASDQLIRGQVVVPRNFRLLAEYDASVGKEGSSLITHPHVGFISYGLVRTIATHSLTQTAGKRR